MTNILITGNTIPDHQLDRLKSAGHAVRRLDGLLTDEELLRELDGVAVHLLGGDEMFTRSVLEKVPASLRLIAFLGTGYASFIDKDAASERGIAITNTPGAMISAVAEQTIGHMINFQRQLSVQNSDVKAGNSKPVLARELYGCTVGVIGLGRIGTAIARLLTAFEADVAYWNRTRRIHCEQLLGIKYMKLEALLETSDIVVMMVPTTPKTEGMIGQNELSRMKRTALLVNTAGARLIKADALYAALRERTIGGAVYDGYYVEPLPTPENDPFQLLGLSDSIFMVTPHTGALTSNARERMARMSVDSILSYLVTGADVHLVT